MKNILHNAKVLIIEENFIVGVDIKNQFTQRKHHALLCMSLADFYEALDNTETDIIITSPKILDKMNQIGTQANKGGWILPVLEGQNQHCSSTTVCIKPQEKIRTIDKPFDAKDLAGWVEEWMLYNPNGKQDFSICH